MSETTDLDRAERFAGLNYSRTKQKNRHKLKHSAELFTFGEDSAEKFREILEQKPAAKTYYPYDKHEWDKLG